MLHQPESKIFWYKKSDSESQEDEQARKGIAKETELEWARFHIKATVERLDDPQEQRIS